MFPSPRIIFFGTPEFAVASLDRLVDAGYNVAAIVTAPDKPAGRGLKLAVSPVGVYAREHGIPLLQPVNLKDPMFREQLKSFCPDLQIVIAFRMLPRSVWELPPLGTFNLHASLLPHYRGAAPINRAIMNGERETGVTTFFINEMIDTGMILLSEKLTIGPDETAGELHDRLMEAGAGLVVETVRRIKEESLVQVHQESLVTSHSLLKTAPKIFKEDCHINWDQDVTRIHDFIRGLSPYPGAFTMLRDPAGELHHLRILRSRPEPSENTGGSGEIITDGKSILKIAAKNGFIHLSELQLQGRKVMHCADFLRGFAKKIAETRAS
jgi:methionyl-tRNA formyltransferase